MPADLVIADPNCGGLAGHYYEYNASLVRAAHEAGLHAIVLTALNVDPALAHALNARPTFSQDIWAGVRLRGPAHRVWANALFLFTLVRALRSLTLAPGAVVFVHSFVHAQILGLALLPFCLMIRPRPRFVYLLRYQPAFYRGLLARYALRLMEILAPWNRIRLTSDSARLARAVEAITTLPIDIVPIPHIPQSLLPPAHPQDAPCHFVSLGNARGEKGIGEILAAICILAENGDATGCRFTLQVNDPDAAAYAAIKAFAGISLPDCTLLSDTLTTEQYQALLAGADAVLLPYWQDIYSCRTSGVFTEALGAGKPVIVTADTWMAEELSLHGAGTICADRDAVSLASAIRLVASQRSRLSAQADKARPAWVAEHNARRLLAEVMGPPHARAAGLPIKRIAVIYPFSDLDQQQSGASRRCGLLLDYLTATGARVHALHAGTTAQTEGLGPRSWLSQLLHGAIRLATLPLPQSIRRHRWLMGAYLHLAWDWPRRRRLRRVIARSDVVLLEYPFWASFVVKTAHRLGRKVILTTDDLLAAQISRPAWLRRIAWWHEARSLRLADTLLAVSREDQSILAGRGIPALLSPNPADSRLFELAALPDPRAIIASLYDVELPPGDIVLFVGSRHTSNMAAVEHLRALARAAKGIVMVVAGRCAEPSRDGNFLALGAVDEGLLLALYAAARVAAIPLTDGTGASVKTVEAMAAGLVVLGTPIAFRGLAVVDGVHGLIEADPDRFAGRLAALLADPVAGRTIANAGKAFARHYDYRQCFAVYRDLLGLREGSACESRFDIALDSLARRAIARGLSGLGAKLLAARTTDAVQG